MMIRSITLSMDRPYLVEAYLTCIIDFNDKRFSVVTYRTHPLPTHSKKYSVEKSLAAYSTVQNQSCEELIEYFLRYLDVL